MRKYFFLALIIIVFLLASCSLLYVTKQGYYQIKMLLGADTIENALRRNDLDIKKRQKIEYATKVRIFAENILGQKKNKNYKKINLTWQNKVYNISGCKELKFAPYEWWFPVIGNVPYKGFFSLEDAKAEETSLIKKGYETNIYSIPGYSTLGYFADPLWPSMLELSYAALGELIIHELTHQALWIKGKVSLNETLANFVSQKALRKFYQENYGEDSLEIIKLNKHHKETKERQILFYNLYQELNYLYQQNISDEKKRQKKLEIFQKAQVDYSKINNAFLLGFKRYNNDFSSLENIFTESKENFLTFINKIKLKYYVE